MLYLPTFGCFFMVHVVRYTIHGCYILGVGPLWFWQGLGWEHTTSGRWPSGRVQKTPKLKDPDAYLPTFQGCFGSKSAIHWTFGIFDVYNIKYSFCIRRLSPNSFWSKMGTLENREALQRCKFVITIFFFEGGWPNNVHVYGNFEEFPY